MVHIFFGYFTDDVIRQIRSVPMYFKMETWEDYRRFHNNYEPVSSKNAVQLMQEFGNVCDIIATLPKASLTPGNLQRIIVRDTAH